MLSLAYDPLNNVFFSGEQDTGSAAQTRLPRRPFSRAGGSAERTEAARYAGRGALAIVNATAGSNSTSEPSSS